MIAWRCLGHTCLTCWNFAAGPDIMVFRSLSLYTSLYYMYFYGYFLVSSCIIWLGWAPPLGSGSQSNHLLTTFWFFFLSREPVPFVPIWVLFYVLFSSFLRVIRDVIFLSFIYSYILSKQKNQTLKI
jgi:hypothetical protein